MAQHVRMHLRSDLGRDAGALDQLGEAGALSKNENED